MAFDLGDGTHRIYTLRLISYSANLSEVTYGDMAMPASGTYHVKYGDGFVGDHDGQDYYFAKTVSASDGLFFHFGIIEMPDW